MAIKYLIMKKLLLLHWWWWNENENWFPRVWEEVKKLWFEYHCPNLPTTDSPVLSKQLEYIKDYENVIKSWDYLVWHSLGCKLIMHFIEKYELTWLNIILVAPVYDSLISELSLDWVWIRVKMNLKKYNEEKVDFRKINTLNNNFTIFLSDNDPYIRMESAKRYYSSLENVKFIDFHNMWHFNEWAWIYKLTDILNYIK